MPNAGLESVSTSRRTAVGKRECSVERVHPTERQPDEVDLVGAELVDQVHETRGDTGERERGERSGVAVAGHVPCDALQLA